GGNSQGSTPTNVCGGSFTVDAEPDFVEVTCTDNLNPPNTNNRGDCVNTVDHGCPTGGGASSWTLHYHGHVHYDHGDCSGSNRTVLICQGIARCSDTPPTVRTASCTTWTITPGTDDDKDVDLQVAGCLNGESYIYQIMFEDAW